MLDFIEYRKYSAVMAKKKVKMETGPAQLPGSEGTGGLLPGGAGGSEPLVLRRQIASALENNPERVKQLFTSWIEEKGGQIIGIDG